MTGLIRIMAFVLLLAAAGLLAASIGVVAPRSFRAEGPGATPVQSWAAYIYEGRQFNFVDTVAWIRPGGIAESGREGAIRLPMLVYVKSPTDGWLEHEVPLIYAPALHATLHVPRPAEGEVLAIPDNSADPEAWAHALDEVYSLVVYDISLAEHSRYDVEPEMTKRLARLAVDEYRALLAAHGNRRRQIPTDIPSHLQFASEADRAEWRARMRREIEREPTWGEHIRRRYAARMGDLEASFGL